MGVLSNDICQRTTPWTLPIHIAHIWHLGSTDVDITKDDVFPEKVERQGRLGTLRRKCGTMKLEKSVSLIDKTNSTKKGVWTTARRGVKSRALKGSCRLYEAETPSYKRNLNSHQLQLWDTQNYIWLARNIFVHLNNYAKGHLISLPGIM